LLIFWGCNAPIYSEKRDFNKPLECLQLEALFEEEGAVVEKYLQISAERKCPYTISVQSHFVHNCSNPRVKSLGSDFDGYVSLKIYNREEAVYHSQTDFKGDDTLHHIDRLVLELIDKEREVVENIILDK
jgi:hypothetical protein